MKDDISISVLKTEIKKGLEVLQKIENFLDNYRKEKLKSNLGLDTEKAMIISQIFANYYTCIETIFFRISSFFENSLNNEKWHKDLLEKMVLDIDKIRPRVISDEVYSILMEFLKFRHFMRYYCEMNYDWDKLLFLLIKYDKAKDKLRKDLDNFMLFIESLRGPEENK